jgi:hypothetical protein
MQGLREQTWLCIDNRRYSVPPLVCIDRCRISTVSKQHREADMRWFRRHLGGPGRPRGQVTICESCGIACDGWCQAEARYARDRLTVHVYGWRPV